MRIRRGFSCFCRNFQDLLKIIAKLLDNTENNRNFVTGFETDIPLILSNILKQQNLQHHGTSNGIYLQARKLGA